MFKILVDPVLKLIRCELDGFWGAEQVAVFFDAEQKAVEALGVGSGEFLLLMDTTGVVQSRETNEAFQQAMLSLKYKAKRVAVVRPSAVARMQTKRILSTRDSADAFATLAEAEAWLLRP